MEITPWQRHLETWKWSQGEHLTLVGTTGCGKTTLAQQILDQRQYVLVLASKPRDPLISSFKQRGYQVMREWEAFDPEENPRVVLWPRISKRVTLDELRQHQHQQFREVLNDVFHAGGWTVYIDEGEYFSDNLRLSEELRMLWQQGRALGVTVVLGTQRPRFVPLAAYSQATHLYIWGNRDEQDADRLSQVSGQLDRRAFKQALGDLPSKHHALYVHKDGKMYVTVADQK